MSALEKLQLLARLTGRYLIEEARGAYRRGYISASRGASILDTLVSEAERREYLRELVAIGEGLFE